MLACASSGPREYRLRVRVSYTLSVLRFFVTTAGAKTRSLVRLNNPINLPRRRCGRRDEITFEKNKNENIGEHVHNTPCPVRVRFNRVEHDVYYYFFLSVLNSSCGPTMIYNATGNELLTVHAYIYIWPPPYW